MRYLFCALMCTVLQDAEICIAGVNLVFVGISCKSGLWTSAEIPQSQSPAPHWCSKTQVENKIVDLTEDSRLICINYELIIRHHLHLETLGLPATFFNERSTPFQTHNDFTTDSRILLSRHPSPSHFPVRSTPW